MGDLEQEVLPWLKPRQQSQIRIISIVSLVAVFVILDFLELGKKEGPSVGSPRQSVNTPAAFRQESPGTAVRGTAADEPSSDVLESQGNRPPAPDSNGNKARVQEDARVLGNAEPEPAAKSFLWRGAPWKMEVGEWFKRCGGDSEPITVEEVVHGKDCSAECNGNGVCNYELGECRCRSGYIGADCGAFDDHPCNLDPFVPGKPSRWIVSICPGFCDNRTGQCLCGPESKYPHRAILEPCGIARDPQGITVTEQTHLSLYSNSSQTPGWCNADPEKARTGEAHPGATCLCAIDGYGGFLCDEESRAYCPGGCNNHGHCYSGYCECRDGWYGIDCSIPSAGTPLEDPVPPWLRVETSLLSRPPSSSRRLLADAGQSDRTLAASLPSEGGDSCGPPDPPRVRPSPGPGTTGTAGGPAGDRAAREEGRGDEVGRGKGTARRRLAEAGDGTVVRRAQRPRPLIYIYDLPGEYTYQQYEGRQIRHYCVPWMYSPNNETNFNGGNLYGMEPAVLEALLASPHRTTDAEAADYFYVPILTGCILARADDSPHMDMQRDFQSIRPWFTTKFVNETYEYIRDSFPYWNRSEGRDHIWMFPWDEGACYAPQAIWNSVMLSPWGNTMAKHKTSTTAYGADNWDAIPKEVRGDHPCFDPEKDIVLPNWKAPEPELIAEHLWAKSFEERDKLFYFSGQLGSAYFQGRPESEYSMGIRQKIARLFGSAPDNDGKLGEFTEPGVVVTANHSPFYALELSTSRFCGVFPGDGFSARMEDSILHGCVPVIVQDGIQLPFENFLDYDSFAVRIAEDDIPHMVTLLKAISEERTRAMLLAIRSLWQRWSYHSVARTEAERQRQWHGHEPTWAQETDKLRDDDAIATLMQLLYYKLYNDPWRKKGLGVKLRQKKDHGFRQHCSL